MTDEVVSAKADDARQLAHELVVGLIEDFRSTGTKINEIVMVPLSIFARIFRTYDAIDILLDNNHPSEAAVILLAQFELGLDLGDTALDIKKATEWMDHSGRKFTPASTKDRIDRLYRDGAEKQDWELIFRVLSGIKHSNPAYSELGFPGRIEGRTLVISTGETLDGFNTEFSRQIRQFAEYHLVYCAHVMSVFVAKYSGMEFGPRRKVYEGLKARENARAEFVKVLSASETRTETFFGIRKLTKG